MTEFLLFGILVCLVVLTGISVVRFLSDYNA